MIDSQLAQRLGVCVFAWLLQLLCLWRAIRRRRQGKPGRATDYVILLLPLIGATILSGGLIWPLLLTGLAQERGYWIWIFLLPTLVGAAVLPFIEPTQGPPDEWHKKWLE